MYWAILSLLVFIIYKQITSNTDERISHKAEELLKSKFKAKSAEIDEMYSQAERHLREAERKNADLPSLTRVYKDKLFAEYLEQLNSLKKEKERILKKQNEENERVLKKLNNEKALLIKYRKETQQIRDDALRFAPFLASMYADYVYLNEQTIADYLEHKPNPAYKAAETVRKVSSEKRSLQKANKLLEYKLNVYEAMFPWLTDFSEASTTDILSVTNPDSDFQVEDPVHNFVSKDEWASLNVAERNQLALDRYNTSHKKTSWQVGRDYELYVGYLYTKKGYSVNYTGSLLKYDDLGRDLIATKGNTVIIIQCKYWSQSKTIHEKHIFQLFGTSVCYKLDHPDKNVKCLLATNTTFSPKARLFAEQMSVSLVDHLDVGPFPQIKCNISSSGERIYHLPMDQQYDSVVINKPGEFYAMTVAEAEAAGYRRAFKWHGQ